MKNSVKNEVKPSLEIMTLEQVATHTGYKKSYIYQLVHRREIPVFKTPKGRKLFFNKPDIDNWLTSRQLATVAELTEALRYY